MKKYIQYTNQYDNFKTGIKEDVKGIVINNLMVPFAMILGFTTLVMLVVIAFGKDNYWGDSGRLLVGIFVPTVLILLIFFKSIGNKIIMAWCFFLFVILIIVPILAIVYCFFTPVFHYFF